ncbi:MAG: glycerophosphodiester phosphodiesterase, partial [Oligoflexales bacterium]|nr:glycerophosphodiester phosphodiesterase [Oligoflexales bacterium]
CTSASFSSKNENFADLVQPWMNTMVHGLSMFVHAWIIDDPEDLRSVSQRSVDGIFTGRPDVGIKNFKSAPDVPQTVSLDEILKAYGW